MSGQHNAHMYAFYNAPLSQKPAYAQFLRAQIAERMTRTYPSADAYYADKQEDLRIRAALEGKQPHQVDPVAYWYGMQSN